eukprot:Gb_17453 [translate_table: standard]
MVGVGEEAELNRLELQVENGGGDVWEYLSLVKKLKVRRSEKVLQHGMTLLDDPKARSKLRGEGPLSIDWVLPFMVLSPFTVVCGMARLHVWTLYEQVAIAAMDCQRLDIAKAIFGGERYIGIPLKELSCTLCANVLSKYIFPTNFIKRHSTWGQPDCPGYHRYRYLRPGCGYLAGRCIDVTCAIFDIPPPSIYVAPFATYVAQTPNETYALIEEWPTPPLNPPPRLLVALLPLLLGLTWYGPP